MLDNTWISGEPSDESRKIIYEAALAKQAEIEKSAKAVRFHGLIFVVVSWRPSMERAQQRSTVGQGHARKGSTPWSEAIRSSLCQLEFRGHEPDA